MSNALQGIIRPFQTGETSPPRMVPFATPTQVASLVKLRIGRSGSVKSFNGSYSASQTLYVVKLPRELTDGDTISAGLANILNAWKPVK